MQVVPNLYLLLQDYNIQTQRKSQYYHLNILHSPLKHVQNYFCSYLTNSFSNYYIFHPLFLFVIMLRKHSNIPIQYNLQLHIQLLVKWLLPEKYLFSLGCFQLLLNKNQSPLIFYHVYIFHNCLCILKFYDMHTHIYSLQ